MHFLSFEKRCIFPPDYILYWQSGDSVGPSTDTLTEWKCELHWNQSVQRTHIEERLSVRCLLDDGRATAADEAICSYWFDPGEVRMEQRGTLTLTERKRHQATMDLSCRLELATSP